MNGPKRGSRRVHPHRPVAGWVIGVSYEPTITDADLVLGILNPENFLGGRVKLDKAKAWQAVEELGREIATPKEARQILGLPA